MKILAGPLSLCQDWRYAEALRARTREHTGGCDQKPQLATLGRTFGAHRQKPVEGKSTSQICGPQPAECRELW